MYKYNPSE